MAEAPEEMPDGGLAPEPEPVDEVRASGLAPSKPPPSVILSALFDKGVRSKFSGEIKSFSLTRGYGFIAVPKVWDLMKCDVHFVLNEVYDVDKDQVAEKVRVGSKCTFWCNLDRSGRPQAKVVRITSVPEGKPPPTAQSAPTPTGPTGETYYTGCIKSFKEDTGYGFISCQETFERFKRDVFLHHKQLNGFKVNDMVKFRIHVDQAKGQPKAFSLEAAGGATVTLTEESAGTVKAEAAVEAEVGNSPQAATSDPDESTQETATLPGDLKEVEAEESQLWESGWTRYRVSEASEDFWWWKEETGEYFMESEGSWSLYMDPESERQYWYHENGRCFWAEPESG